MYYLVGKLSLWKDLKTNTGIPLTNPEDGSIGMIPIYDDEGKAKEVAGDKYDIYMIRPKEETNETI